LSTSPSKSSKHDQIISNKYIDQTIKRDWITEYPLASSISQTSPGSTAFDKIP
jgi:hypothetical protein